MGINVISWLGQTALAQAAPPVLGDDIPAEDPPADPTTGEGSPPAGATPEEGGTTGWAPAAATPADGIDAEPLPSRPPPPAPPAVPPAPATRPPSPAEMREMLDMFEMYKMSDATIKAMAAEREKEGSGDAFLASQGIFGSGDTPARLGAAFLADFTLDPISPMWDASFRPDVFVKFVNAGSGLWKIGLGSFVNLNYTGAQVEPVQAAFSNKWSIAGAPSSMLLPEIYGEFTSLNTLHNAKLEFGVPDLEKVNFINKMPTPMPMGVTGSYAFKDAGKWWADFRGFVTGGWNINGLDASPATGWSLFPSEASGSLFGARAGWTPFALHTDDPKKLRLKFPVGLQGSFGTLDGFGVTVGAGIYIKNTFDITASYGGTRYSNDLDQTATGNSITGALALGPYQPNAFVTIKPGLKVQYMDAGIPTTLSTGADVATGDQPGLGGQAPGPEGVPTGGSTSAEQEFGVDAFSVSANGNFTFADHYYVNPTAQLTYLKLNPNGTTRLIPTVFLNAGLQF